MAALRRALRSTQPLRQSSGRTLALLTLALCLPAAAQVVRCTDPATGRITYTDGGCASGQAVQEVLPPKSPEDIAREQQQAEAALARKHERQQRETAERAAERAAELEAARIEALRNPAPPPAYPAYPTPAPAPIIIAPPYGYPLPGHGGRPPHWRPPPPPPEITRCNVFRCYDRQGNSYPR